MNAPVIPSLTFRRRRLWRDYWATRWHSVTQWPLIGERKGAFLTAEAARQGEFPAVADAPTGTKPLLGVLTLGAGDNASPASGLVQFPMPGHLLTVAPTRTGKGTCHIVPNLFLYSGSAVVLDVKGENCDITANHRRTMFRGAKVIRFAPFSDDTDRYNPLDFIRTDEFGSPDADTFDDVWLLTEMLLPSKGPREEFWDTEARNLLAAIILYVICRYTPGKPERNLRTVVEALFREPDGNTKGFKRTLDDLLEAAALWKYAPLQALAASLFDHDEKVRAGIFSTCRADMKIWLSERLQNATEASDFRFSELKESMCRPIKDNPAPTTLYVVIPPEYLRAYRGIVRMMIGLAAIELTRPPSWLGQPGWRARPPGPVLFLLDELPALGRMNPISEGLAYLAGYDVQLWAFAQNVGQLKEIYGDAWHNFPANSGATMFFGVNDPDTAEYVERLLGETPEKMVYYTHRTSNSTFDTGRDPGKMSSSQIGTAQSHRFMREKVISAAEIRALPDPLQLIFIRNRQPIIASKLPYHEFELIEGLADQWLLGATGS